MPLEKQLLCTLWVLGNPEALRSIGDRFDMAESTVYNTYRRMVRTINEHLAPKFIKWSKHIDQFDKLKETFGTGGLPDVIGAIDGCHIPIKAPRENDSEYINRKCFHSLQLQAVCDGNLMFVDVYCGWPGSVHDATVLRVSPLAIDAKINETEMFNGCYIIGDQAYRISVSLA